MFKKILVISMAVATLAVPSGIPFENSQSRIDELRPRVQAARAQIRAAAEDCGVDEATAHGFLAKLKEAPLANFSSIMDEIRAQNECFANKLDNSGAAEKLAGVRDRLFAAYERLSNTAVDVTEQSIQDVISELKNILNSA